MILGLIVCDFPVVRVPPGAKLRGLEVCLVRAANVNGKEQPMAALTLTRGARHVTFLAKGRTLVFLRGDIQHKNLWARDLSIGAERQLTNLAPGFNIRDFDVSPDGREVIIERVQERSDVVLLDLPQR